MAYLPARCERQPDCVATTSAMASIAIGFTLSIRTRAVTRVHGFAESHAPVPVSGRCIHAVLGDAFQGDPAAVAIVVARFPLEADW